jgi:aminopeptidase N
MGSDIDAAAWSRIAASLDTLEQDERGTPGHAAFLTYARSILKPVAVALGWDPKPNDTPDIGDLRRTAIGYLGFWGDPDVIAEARKRFAAYRADHTAIPVDYQSTVFNIVAHGADATTFDQLHALAKAATDSTEIGRIQNAMMLVSDDDLAKRAAEIALSDEVPPQDAANRVQFIFELADFHPAMAWALFKAHADEILKPFGPLEGPVALAQYTPDGFWNAAPLDEIEAWIKSKIQPPYYPLLQRGMERARFHVAQQKLLDTAADAYVAQH